LDWVKEIKKNMGEDFDKRALSKMPRFDYCRKSLTGVFVGWRVVEAETIFFFVVGYLFHPTLRFLLPVRTTAK